ncbi:hypothetical protein Dimus_039828 [Dionaea muscipula]
MGLPSSEKHASCMHASRRARWAPSYSGERRAGLVFSLAGTELHSSEQDGLREQRPASVVEEIRRAPCWRAPRMGTTSRIRVMTIRVHRACLGSRRAAKLRASWRAPGSRRRRLASFLHGEMMSSEPGGADERAAGAAEVPRR